MIKKMVSEIPENRQLHSDYETNMKLYGILADSVKFIERNQLCDLDLWKKFIDQYRQRPDGVDGLWRCEFWGKMMRGACMVLEYTKDDGFYRIIESMIRDMLTTQDELGRFSTYTVDTEFTSWDLWGRKYVMLGMQYFLEICQDEALAEEIVSALCRHADYIIEHIGREDEGKKEIVTASRHWKGLNSSSILEPMIRLYRITGEQKYLSFGEYIISTGFIKKYDLIDLAYENNLAPHEYPVVKAYEMMSCFEGLLQYYCLTGNEKHKKALVNFGHRILEGEISVIGCSGCTHELFDHTAIKQTQTEYKGIVQETCVTVTWMKFAEAMLELTGEVEFADAIEQSFYNAYLGSFNTHRVPVSQYPRNKDLPTVLPFDSYSPLTPDRRGRQVGGYNMFSDGSFYGCCACIAAAGSGIIPKFALLRNNGGLVLNFYEKGSIKTVTPNGQELEISMMTDYPIDGKIKISLMLENEEAFDLTLRVPAWCDGATITLDGEKKNLTCGYNTISKTWGGNDELVLDLPMTVKRIAPPKGAINEDLFAAYKRGPIVLAADARLVDPDSIIDIPADQNGVVEGELVYCPEIKDNLLCVKLEDTSGREVRLVDYSSAGKTYDNDSRCAAWMYIAKEMEV